MRQLHTANPQLPITERDYCLSELFQFLYVPIKIRFSLEDSETDVREKVQEFLNTIPDAMLPQLRRFDWEGFYFDSRYVELNRLLGAGARRLRRAVIAPTSNSAAPRPHDSSQTVTVGRAHLANNGMFSSP